MRHLLGLCVLLWVLTAPAAAGVVEDAEEELRKLREAQGQAQSAPSYSPPPYPSPPNPSSSRPRSTPASNSPGTSSAPQTSPGAEPSAARIRNSPDEVEELSRRPRVVTQEDKKGYFFSFLFILLFAVLIALASLYGRRVESEE